MSVRVAVIGAGVMGADHARIIAEELPGAVLKVICDAAEERARVVADKTGAVHIDTRAERVIGRSDVDAVLIASPDQTHAALTLVAIEKRKPVLCEKPLAHASAQCLQIVDAEVRLGYQLVQVGFMRRFDPGCTEMRRSVRRGDLGRPLLMHNVHRNRTSPGSWFTDDMVISNSASHEFDIARFVLDTDFRSITAFRPQRSDGELAPVFLVLDTVDGKLVNIEINNNAAYGYDVRAEVVGERGSIALNPASHTRLDRDLSQSTAHCADWRARFADAYRMQDKAWLRSIELDEPSALAANAWDSVVASAVAEAGIRALQSKQTMPVDLLECPTLYSPRRSDSA